MQFSPFLVEFLEKAKVVNPCEFNHRVGLVWTPHGFAVYHESKAPEGASESIFWGFDSWIWQVSN